MTATLPDKAIDVIDEAGAAQRILVPASARRPLARPKSKRSSPRSRAFRPPMCPTTTATSCRRWSATSRAWCSAGTRLWRCWPPQPVKMARSGLGKGDKPIGSFLFSGPTGVGKTEAAKQLAYIMGIDLIRFDMSGVHGAPCREPPDWRPPGYVGFDQGGLLTEAITKKPHACCCWTKSKAHPTSSTCCCRSWTGTLTDNNGRKADFRNVLIIMTTNAGRRDHEQGHHRLLQTRARRATRWATSKRLFTPEFRNRLDAIVNFKALDEQIILRVVDKFLLQLKRSWPRKGGSHLHRRLAQALARGFDPL